MTELTFDAIYAHTVFGRAHFAEQWVAARAANRIGRIVFMGTPFLTKTWLRGNWWSPLSIVSGLIEIIAGLAAGIVWTYVSLIYLWSISWLLSLVAGYLFSQEPVLAPIFDPRFWSNAVLVPFCIIALVAGLLFCVGLVGWRRRDVNVYFTRRGLSSFTPRFPAALPYRVLNINAGYLDEALLALSGEAIVYGALAPQIRAFAGPRMRLRFQVPAGQDHGIRYWLFWAIGVFGQAAIVSIATIASPFIRIWERRFSRSLLEIVSGAATGLPRAEFVQARIMVGKRIERADFFNETIIDVGRTLIASQPSRRIVNLESNARYAFIWDEEERDRRIGQSWLWAQLRSSISEIDSFASVPPSKDPESDKARLKDVCLMLEERVREVAGIVEIVHSMYYSNKSIIDDIAGFIAGKDGENDELPVDRKGAK